jgi:hypothetical protein
VIKGAVYNGTKSGWSDEDCFFDYLQKLFIPNTKHLKKPLLLIFDGHYSHLSIKTVRLAIENDIHLLCLPSHSTHLLQPLDIYTLKYVKQQWKELLWERNKRMSIVRVGEEEIHPHPPTPTHPHPPTPTPTHPHPHPHPQPTFLDVIEEYFSDLFRFRCKINTEMNLFEFHSSINSFF